MCLSLSERYALLEGRNEEIKFLHFKCKEFRRQKGFSESSGCRLKRKGSSLDALTVSAQKKISKQEAHRACNTCWVNNYVLLGSKCLLTPCKLRPSLGFWASQVWRAAVLLPWAELLGWCCFQAGRLIFKFKNKTAPCTFAGKGLQRIQ